MIATLLFTPNLLMAHPGDGEIHTLSDGLQHFFSGWDHVLLSALAGLIIASGRKLWGISSISAAIIAPLAITLLHQSMILPDQAQWMGSVGLGLASVIILAMTGLSTRWKPLNSTRVPQLKRIGLGLAVLALAWTQI